MTSNDPYLTPTYTIFSLLHVSPSGKRPAWAKPKIWPIRKDFMIANRNSESLDFPKYSSLLYLNAPPDGGFP